MRMRGWGMEDGRWEMGDGANGEHSILYYPTAVYAFLARRAEKRMASLKDGGEAEADGEGERRPLLRE